MDIEIDQEIFDICKKHIKSFKSECLDADYDYFKNTNQDEFNILYIQSCLLDPKNMKKLKNKLLNSGIKSKYINDLFYTILKFNYKYDVGNFSWFEIDMWNIEPELIKKTSTKYTLI